MEIVDANIVLRYLLNDNEPFAEKSKEIIEQHTIFLSFEVCAEIVYVLEKVYKAPRNKIEEALILLINYPNLITNDSAVIVQALKIYNQKKIDFVDSILVSYNQVNGDIIHSFDKKIQKLCH